MKRFFVLTAIILTLSMVMTPVCFANQSLKLGSTILLAQADTGAEEPQQAVGVKEGSSFWNTLTPAQQGILLGGGALAIGGIIYVIADDDDDDKDGSPSNPN